MALSLTSINNLPERSFRTVACLPEGSSGGISGGPIAIGQDLIGQVQDQAVRESAREWYNFLTEVELSSLSQRQSIRASYGIKAPLFASAADYAIPTLAPLTPAAAYSPLGSLFPAPRFTGFTSSARPIAQAGGALYLPRF